MKQDQNRNIWYRDLILKNWGELGTVMINLLAKELNKSLRMTDLYTTNTLSIIDSKILFVLISFSFAQYQMVCSIPRWIFLFREVDYLKWPLSSFLPIIFSYIQKKLIKIYVTFGSYLWYMNNVFHSVCNILISRTDMSDIQISNQNSIIIFECMNSLKWQFFTNLN